MPGTDFRSERRILSRTDSMSSPGSGRPTVTDPVLEDIIEQLQTCILSARALKLEMLEHILSIALLEAYVARGNRDKED